MTITATTKTQKMAPRADYTIEVGKLSGETVKHVTPGIVEKGVEPQSVRDAVFKHYELCGEYGLELTDTAVVFYYAVTGRLDRHLDVLSPESVSGDPERAAMGEISFLENHTRTLGLTNQIDMDGYGPRATGEVIGSDDFLETLFKQVKRKVHRTASFGFLKSMADFEMVEPSAMLSLYGEFWADAEVAANLERAGALVKHYRRKVMTFETSIVSTAPAQPGAFVIGTKSMEKVDGLELRQELASNAINTPVNVAALALQLKGLDYGTLEAEEIAELKNFGGIIGAGLATAEDVRSAAWIAETAELIKAGAVS